MDFRLEICKQCNEGVAQKIILVNNFFDVSIRMYCEHECIVWMMSYVKYIIFIFATV